MKNRKRYHWDRKYLTLNWKAWNCESIESLPQTCWKQQKKEYCVTCVKLIGMSLTTQRSGNLWTVFPSIFLSDTEHSMSITHFMIHSVVESVVPAWSRLYSSSCSSSSRRLCIELSTRLTRAVPTWLPAADEVRRRTGPRTSWRSCGGARVCSTRLHVSTVPVPARARSSAIALWTDSGRAGGQ